MTDALLLSVREAAHLVGVGRDRMYALVRAGDVRSIAVGAKRLVPRVELERWIDRELETKSP